MADADTSADYVGPALSEGSTILEQVVVVRYLDEEGDSVLAYHVHHDSAWNEVVGMLSAAEHLVVMQEFNVLGEDGEPPS